MEGRGKLKETDHLQDLGVNGRSGIVQGKKPLGRARSRWRGVREMKERITWKT
jgi:hypothetical protein